MRGIAGWIGLVVIVLLLLPTFSCIPDQPIPETTTFVVAAKNSSPKSRSQADYVCSQTDFHTVMAQAIADLSNEGGSIYLMEGTYIKTVADGIEATKDNVKISGCGKATQIRLADGINADASIFKATDKKGIIIENIHLHGNDDNQSSGEQWAVNFTNCQDCKLSVWIEYFNGGEARVPGSEVEVTNLFCRDNKPLVLLHCSTSDGPWIEEEISGGASYEIDTADYVEGDSSLKITLPMGSKIRIRNGAFTSQHGGKYSDLRWKRLYWWFKIECESPVHLRKAFLMTHNSHRIDTAWERSIDWVQYHAEIYYPPESYDKFAMYTYVEIDNSSPNSSDCIVWIDGVYAEPNYPELPVATFSFDDGFSSWQKTADTLDEYGYKGCFNVVTSGEFWTDDKKDMYGKFAKGGHEIASHSLTHAFKPQSIWEELIKSRQIIQAEGLGPCRFFVKPGVGYVWYGDTPGKIGTVYAGFRSTVNYSNGTFFPMTLRNIGSTGEEEIRQFIVMGIKQHNWMFLYAHGMKFDPYYDPDGVKPDGVTEERLRFICDLLDELGVPVKTYSEVATEERFPTPDVGRLLTTGAVVQRIGPCAPASNTSVHPAVNLTDEEQVITTNINNPDVYRCIRVMSNSPASAPARARFSGTGLNDMTSGGTYTGDLVRVEEPHPSYVVQIDSVGTPDTFRWSFGQRGSLSEPIAITGEAQLLSDGITVTFANTTGHTSGDTWAFGAVANVRVVGKNWDGLERMETIYLTDDTNPIDGQVPFKSLSEIYIPAEPDGGSGHSISIGVCDKLGLYHFIGSSSDVTQLAKKAAVASKYTIEPLRVVDAYYGTLDVSPVADGDSFEFCYNAL